MTMTPEQIAAAWALVNAATKGPWFAESGHEQGNGQLYWQVTDATDAIMQNQFCWCQGDHAANAAFIAASRELVPQLLTALEAERAKVKRLVDALEPFACAAETWMPEEPSDATAKARIEHPHYGMEPHGEFTFGDLFRARALLAEIKETDHE